MEKQIIFIKKSDKQHGKKFSADVHTKRFQEARKKRKGSVGYRISPDKTISN